MQLMYLSEGMVPAFQIIDYLKNVTDPSRDGKRLQCLSDMLDPHGQSTLVDLLTFRKAMSKWIESCWMERFDIICKIFLINKVLNEWTTFPDNDKGSVHYPY